MWDEVLERVHDLARLGLLVVLEDAGNNDHGGQHNTEVQVVHVGMVDGGRLEAVGEEAEDGSDPEEGGEAAEQVLAELDPLRGGLGRGEGVGTVQFEVLRRLLGSQTLESFYFINWFLKFLVDW